jgi:hypothetical protein
MGHQPLKLEVDTRPVPSEHSPELRGLKKQVRGFSAPAVVPTGVKDHLLSSLAIWPRVLIASQLLVWKNLQVSQDTLPTSSKTARLPARYRYGVGIRRVSEHGLSILPVVSTLLIKAPLSWRISFERCIQMEKSDRVPG